MASLASYLPPHDGLLPKWLLLVSIVSLANSVQAYTTLRYTQRVYAGRSPSPATPLSARTFGTWTLLSSVVRLHAAYHVGEPGAYRLAASTFAVALAHFAAEWLVFGTARWGAGLAGPVAVSAGSLVWMWAVWGSYVG